MIARTTVRAGGKKSHPLWRVDLDAMRIPCVAVGGDYCGSVGSVNFALFHENGHIDRKVRRRAEPMYFTVLIPSEPISGDYGRPVVAMW